MSEKEGIEHNFDDHLTGIYNICFFMDHMEPAQKQQQLWCGEPQNPIRIPRVVARGSAVFRRARMSVVLKAAILLASALIPAVLAITLLGESQAPLPERKPTDLHSLPVSYRGEPITWARADFLLESREGMVMNIDMRAPTNEQVVLFDTEAEQVRWLCGQRVQRQGC